jgi:hypothetical protein
MLQQAKRLPSILQNLGGFESICKKELTSFGQPHKLLGETMKELTVEKPLAIEATATKTDELIFAEEIKE